MKSWTLAIMGLASVAWVGCVSRGTPGGMPKAPLQVSSTVCLTPHEKARECRDVNIGAATRTICDIDVLHQGKGKTNIYPYSQNIPNGPVRIVWEVRGQGKEFRLSDGPLELKTSAACVSASASPSTDRDGTSPSSSGKYYRIDCDGSQVGSRIHYTIQFTDKDGNTRSCDPNIVSENG